MLPVIDHIQLTVADMERALAFYDRLMPLLGFDLDKRSRAYLESHDLDVAEYVHPRLCFAIDSPRASEASTPVHRRSPGALHHLAFKAESREQIDGLYPRLVELGARIVEPPREYPETTPAGYYAVFFKDPEGIK